MADQSLLIIADIGGYTKFMKLHRVSLAHAEDITGRLLRTLVEASPLPLIEIEGDGAFFAAPLDQADGSATEISLAMHQSFHARLERMIALSMCSCDACLQSRDLKVKFVGHVGEVATQRIGGREKIVGVDVITVHRMLKNAVPVPEYLLMTEPLVELCGTEVRRSASRFEQELDGLGPTSLYFVDLEDSALPRPPPPKPTLPGRIGETIGLAFRGFPRVVGLRRSRRESSDLEP